MRLLGHIVGLRAQRRASEAQAAAEHERALRRAAMRGRLPEYYEEFYALRKFKCGPWTWYTQGNKVMWIK